MRSCPECGERLSEHNPFDPELLRRGLFRSSRTVYACRYCGYLDVEVPSGPAQARAAV